MKGMSRFFRFILWRLPDVIEAGGRHVWLPARSLQFSDYGARRFASQTDGSAYRHLRRLPGLRQRIPLRLARNEDRGIADKRRRALPGYEGSRVRVTKENPAALFLHQRIFRAFVAKNEHSSLAFPRSCSAFSRFGSAASLL